jgi:hypothetical protein
MRLIALLAAAPLALVLAASAAAETKPAAPPLPAPSPYKVVQENTRIPFAANQIDGFRVGADKSLILEGPGRRWYRVTLESFCQRDLPWENFIGLDSNFGALDRFDSIIVDGRRCRIRTLDQIEDPRPVDRALRAAKKAG